MTVSSSCSESASASAAGPERSDSSPHGADVGGRHREDGAGHFPASSLVGGEQEVAGSGDDRDSGRRPTSTATYIS